VKQIPPPDDLSEISKALWLEMTATHAWDRHELVTFEWALKWQDTSRAATEQAKAAKGAELARLTKLSLDASTAALRHWRALKFPAPEGARRPGRPSGSNWSAARKAAMESRHA
jgi:hypothetical protein